MIRLLIVEDHPAIGAGIGLLLADEPDIEVLEVARDVAAAQRLVREAAPDVVLCDVLLNGSNGGLDLLRGSRRHRSRFLMFSAYTYPANFAAAVDGGAAGYVSKTASIEEIVLAIRTVAAGGRAFPDDVLRRGRSALPRPTPRQLELISQLARGATNAQIAERLSVHEKTVESQLRRLFDRYGVSNRTELARKAEDEGWLVAPDR